MWWVLRFGRSRFFYFIYSRRQVGSSALNILLLKPPWWGAFFVLVYTDKGRWHSVAKQNMMCFHVLICTNLWRKSIIHSEFLHTLKGFEINLLTTIESIIRRSGHQKPPFVIVQINLSNHLQLTKIVSWRIKGKSQFSFNQLCIPIATTGGYPKRPRWPHQL